MRRYDDQVGLERHRDRDARAGQDEQQPVRRQAEHKRQAEQGQQRDGGTGPETAPHEGLMQQLLGGERAEPLRLDVARQFVAVAEFLDRRSPLKVTSVP
mgnify:CR=1 FL=1